LFVPGRRAGRADPDLDLAEELDESDDDQGPPGLGDVVDLESRRRGAR
jgi:hypothetical protein